MSRVTLGALLLVMWLLLWGSVSVANVASGCIVIAVLFTVFPTRRPLLPIRGPRPVALIRLAGFVAYEMVVSSLLLARQVLSRHTRLEARVVEVELSTTSQSLLTLITNLTALTPGTMTVAVSTTPPVVTLHTLVLQDLEAISENLRRLERLCVRAFGSRSEIAEIERSPRS
jgi:multicomponent Na+:H+ antiporter subunit E